MTAITFGDMPTTDVVKRHIHDETILSPRFYTTDFAALDRIDVEPVRAEWETLLAEMEADPKAGRMTEQRRTREIAVDREIERCSITQAPMLSCQWPENGQQVNRLMKSTTNVPDPRGTNTS